MEKQETETLTPQSELIPKLVRERMLSFNDEVIQKALDEAHPTAAGIKLPPLAPDEAVEDLSFKVGFYVGEISVDRSVLDHVHKKNPEYYHIREGKGSMITGSLINDGTAVKHNEPIELNKGDWFVVDEGVTHSLSNIGDKPLLLDFGGERAHVVNIGEEEVQKDGTVIKGDRTFVNQLPEAS